jgi:hypothetical protein
VYLTLHCISLSVGLKCFPCLCYSKYWEDDCRNMLATFKLLVRGVPSETELIFPPKYHDVQLKLLHCFIFILLWGTAWGISPGQDVNSRRRVIRTVPSAILLPLLKRKCRLLRLLRCLYASPPPFNFWTSWQIFTKCHMNFMPWESRFYEFCSELLVYTRCKSPACNIPPFSIPWNLEINFREVYITFICYWLQWQQRIRCNFE